MLSPIQEWRGPLCLDSMAGLLTVCQHVGRALQAIPGDHQRRHALDRLGHLAVGLLYGREENGSEDDYAWWCDRMGVMPGDTSPHDLIARVGGLNGQA